VNSLEALTAFARAKLRARSPRWLSAAGGTPPDPSAPVISPADYRTDFAAWNTLGLDLPQARELARREAAGEPTGHAVSFGLSTGTLGTPGVFIASQRDRARWLGTFLARVLTTGELVDFVRAGRVAVLLRHDSRLYHQTQRRTAFFPLGRGEEAIAAGLAAFRPNIIVGPPFALRRIVESATFARAPWQVRLVVAGGEPLWPEDAAVLRARLGAPVRQVYQAAEGFFGASCAHGRLHLNVDIVQFERASFVAAPDRFIPIVTDMTRHGPQRLLRYRTDDIAMESDGPCPCGSALPAIAAIEGRLSDVLLAPSGRLLFPRAVHQEIAPALDGAPFRLVQTDAARMTLHLPEHLAADNVRRAVEAAKSCCECDVTTVPLVLPPLDDKFRRFERRIPLGDDVLAQRLCAPTTLSTSARNAARGR
jgi:putative adenylate-forming enzyme